MRVRKRTCDSASRNWIMGLDRALEEALLMGRLLTLNPPYNGMSAIVNVLGRVGPGEQNNPDDVRVVQRLLQMASRGKAFAGSIGVPQTTGRFDAVTGFWIFDVQASF